MIGISVKLRQTLVLIFCSRIFIKDIAKTLTKRAILITLSFLAITYITEGNWQKLQAKSTAFSPWSFFSPRFLPIQEGGLERTFGRKQTHAHSMDETKKISYFYVFCLYLRCFAHY